MREPESQREKRSNKGIARVEGATISINSGMNMSISNNINRKEMDVYRGNFGVGWVMIARGCIPSSRM